MAGASLVISRRQLANGVGQTTRENRVLPFAALAVQIPARVGIFDPGAPAVVVEIPACLPSNFWTYTSAYPWYARAWHTATDTLVSSDGAMRLDRTAHKRITVQGGKPSLSTDPIHLCFASPTVSAVPEPAAGVNDWHFVETAYANREWHAKQKVNVFPLSLIGCAQRLKSIEFKQAGTTFAFRWNFKTPTDADHAGVTPTCLNRTGYETTLLDRKFSSAAPRSRLYKFQLVTPEGKGEFELRSAPWGILPATTFAACAILGTEGWESEGNRGNLTDLSRLLSFGQPYHGLCTTTAVTTADGGAAASPSSYAPPSDAQTRYFKHPSPPGEPAADLLPPDYAASGYHFMDDIVFAGGTNYGPGGGGLPSRTAWLHVAADGTTAMLALSLVSDTATTTTWQVRKYTGQLADGTTTYSVIGTIAIDTTDPYLTGLVPTGSAYRTYTGSYDYQIPTTGGGMAPQSPPGKEHWATDVWLNRYHFVESSPDGRQIAVMRGFYNPAIVGASVVGYYNYGLICTVATFDIAPDFTISGPTYVYQHAYSYQAYSNFSADFCLGFAYRKTGDLFTWLYHEEWTTIGDKPIPPYNTPTPAHRLDAASYNGTALTYTDFPPAETWIEKRFAPYHTTALRLSNNCFLQFVFIVGSTTKVEFSTPSGTTDYATAMSPDIYSPNGRAASWNPRTEQLRARANSGRISWV